MGFMQRLFDPKTMRGITVAAAVLPPALALPLGCASPPEPVAVVRLAVDRGHVSFGAPVDVIIQFDVAPDFEPLGEDYRVFLQLRDDEERLLWTIEHAPSVPTSAWQPGQSIQYTERIRIPPYPYIGPATLAIGLHSPVSGARLALAGDHLGELAYRVATLVLDPPHESSFLVYDEGWYPVEFNVFDRSEWRWTTERAVLSFRNPRQPVRLMLGVRGRPDLFEQPQRLSLVTGERTLDEVTVDTNEPVHLDYVFAAADLGDDDVVRLELRVDRTFRPADSGGSRGDTRELGLRVFDVFVEPVPE